MFRAPASHGQKENKQTTTDDGRQKKDIEMGKIAI